MKEIGLERKAINHTFAKAIPALLEEYDERTEVMLSEADIRLLGIRNFANFPQLVKEDWMTSTLLATKRKTAKVILPYERISKQLTDVTKSILSWINPDEALVSYGISLNIGGRWKKLQGSGVYTRQIKDWFEKKEGVLIGLNEPMTEEQAGRCPLLLTKLGHPDYVDFKFARSANQVAEIIGRTFELGKKAYGHENMMGQFLPGVSSNAILRAWYVCELGVSSGSWAGPYNSRKQLTVFNGRDAEEPDADRKTSYPPVSQAEQRIRAHYGDGPFPSEIERKIRAHYDGYSHKDISQDN